MPATREKTIKMQFYLLRQGITASLVEEGKPLPPGASQIFVAATDILEGFLLDVASIADSLRSIDNDHHGIARK